MANIGHRYVCAAGHARAVWRQWLKGTAIVVAIAAGLFAASGQSRGPIEATAQLERIAARLGGVSTIHPDMAREIARLIRQPWHDCNQVACSGELQARNSAARARITTLLAEKKGAGTIQSGVLAAASWPALPAAR